MRLFENNLTVWTPRDPEEYIHMCITEFDDIPPENIYPPEVILIIPGIPDIYNDLVELARTAAMVPRLNCVLWPFIITAPY